MIETVIKKRQLTLKDVPNDIFNMLLEEQTRIKKEKRTGQYGMEQVVYSMLRGLIRKQKDENVHS